MGFQPHILHIIPDRQRQLVEFGSLGQQLINLPQWWAWSTSRSHGVTLFKPQPLDLLQGSWRRCSPQNHRKSRLRLDVWCISAVMSHISLSSRYCIAFWVQLEPARLDFKLATKMSSFPEVCFPISSNARATCVSSPQWLQSKNIKTT